MLANCSWPPAMADRIKTTQTKKIQVNNEINAVFNDLKKMLNNIESEVFKILGQI